ncbi:lysophospholipid acyltransferase 7-like [Acanthaster planci]|uniref:Lysophospholipid acyltransferase 7 n=1 Tax=Acanthaster planci TaxID=133434 RepID=A0A8B7ZAM2_ACAPL|nr:lysophospholipid acyltransferase 7-like [Acanthaster planci]
MSPTEFIYLCMLLISLGLGHVVKHARNPQEKRLICTLVGVSMVVGLCGWQAYHSIFTTLVAGVIVAFVDPEKCHIWNFAFCFSYLTFFRAGHFFGLAAPTAFSNVVQLLLTLKLVGVAFEVHDSHDVKTKPKISPSNSQVDTSTKARYIADVGDPGIMDVFQYAFCFIGIITGPYYKYKTYCDMIQCKNSKDIPSIDPLVQRLKTLVPIGLMFLIMSHYLSIDYVRSDEFYTHGYWYRTLYMVPMFMLFRLRMYSAWILSECVCMSATLGAYPVSFKPKVGLGPSVDPAGVDSSDKPTEYSYETIHNIDWYQCDFTTTFRDGMRNWNMSVQWWLKNYVFFRFPVKAWSTSITMLVSSYWHGIHPGYFLSFLTVPIILIAEDSMMRSFRTEANAPWYDKFNWFFRMRAFEYLAMGFLLLGFWSTMRYWASTFFIVHVVTFLFIAIGHVCRPKKNMERK